MALDCAINDDANEAGDDMVAEGLAQVLKDAGINVEDLATWTGEAGVEEGRWITISFSNFKLYISRGTDPQYYYSILPTLEF